MKTNKLKNYHSLRSFGRTENARPYERRCAPELSMKIFIAILLSVFITAAIADEKWSEQITDANHYLAERQNELMSEYKLGEHKRFDWDQDSESLVFSNDGVVAVIAKVQFVGSISTKSNTWLWSWGNSTIQDNVKDQMHIVKSYGEKFNYKAITTDKWKGDEIDGWEMTSIAAKLLNAKGAYRTSSDNGFTYMVITEIKWANS